MIGNKQVKLYDVLGCVYLSRNFREDNMKRIAIVEDEKEYQKILTNYLRRYGEENGEDFQISYYSDGIDFVDEYVSQYEIILLDIKMKFMDGWMRQK